MLRWRPFIVTIWKYGATQHAPYSCLCSLSSYFNLRYKTSTGFRAGQIHVFDCYPMGMDICSCHHSLFQLSISIHILGLGNTSKASKTYLSKKHVKKVSNTYFVLTKNVSSEIQPFYLSIAIETYSTCHLFKVLLTKILTTCFVKKYIFLWKCKTHPKIHPHCL